VFDKLVNLNMINYYNWITEFLTKILCLPLNELHMQLCSYILKEEKGSVDNGLFCQC
jgi:hypothetical protein